MFACFIRPAFERRGIGRALMQATENGLRAAGVERVWLSTGGFDEPNVRALGFYRHLGWVDDGRLEDGQVVFRKHLSSE